MGNEASYGYLAAAMGSVTHETEGRTERLGDASWAIFDADAVAREKWDPRPPYVDPAGYFFKADTLVDLAGKIKNPHQKLVMSGAVLQAIVERYNSFVDAGKDADFGKRGPMYRIQRRPFYAAWATPGLHDSLAGLRINGKAQVVDPAGQGDRGSLCRRRGNRWTGNARAGAVHGVRPHRRYERGR